MDQHLHLRPALEQRVELADVVVVVMGQQHVRGRHPAALGGLDQRLDRTARVDEERRAAVLADEVGVGQELRVQRALEDHALQATTRARAGRLRPWPS